jgi:hypothetical protein
MEKKTSKEIVLYNTTEKETDRHTYTHIHTHHKLRERETETDRKRNRDQRFWILEFANSYVNNNIPTSYISF